MTNSEILAAWILHAANVGPEGRLIPTEREINKILDDPPERFEEAHALAQAFVEKIQTKPDNIVSATKGFIHQVTQLNERFGNVLGAPPASKHMPGGRLRR
jgi:hypothetical protein